MPNISPGSLLLILVIVLVVFGTKRLRNLGSDLGGALKGFRSAMSDAEETKEKLDNTSADADFDNTPVEENREHKDT